MNPYLHLSLLLPVLLATPLHAQVLRLLPADSRHADEFGRVVALGPDHAFVSSRFTDDGAGGFVPAVYVFQRQDESAWVQAARLAGAAGSDFGAAMATDGDRLIIGAPSTPGASERSGAAMIYERDAAGGWEKVADLVSGSAEYASFGKAVAIEGDRALVGASGVSGFDPGAAFFFRRDPSGAWTSAQVFSSNGGFRDNTYGFSSSVDIDGGRLAVGVTQAENPGRGAVYLYEAGENSTYSSVAIVQSADELSYFSGDRMDLDGDRLLVGLPDSNVTYVFEPNSQVKLSRFSG